MKRLFAAVFALACVVESTSGFAASGTAPGIARVHGSRGAHGPPPPRIPSLQNRIPAPLPPPPQAPIINGPLSPTGLPPMGGARLP